MKNIKNFTLAELKEYFINKGEKEYRAKEIFRAIYKNHITNFREITTLPAEMRERLSNEFFIQSLEITSKIRSKDRTEKYLFKLPDGNLIETVLIRDKNKNGKYRSTLCMSTQVGCSMGCKFCATGKMGFKRNLFTGEIVEQFITIENKSKIQNIVFMGMGEPFLNYENTKKAVEILTDNEGRALGRRKITVSTSGIIDKIYKFTDEVKSVKLAISLHSAIQEKRNFLMPGLREQPLSELLKALRYYSQKTGNTLTIEYLLIKDLNDSIEDVRALIKFLRKIKFVKVNLIHYNRVPFVNFEPSPREERFLSILLEAGIRTTLRKSKGTEISAACGQLANKNIKDFKIH
jgi:23S rRNA (adenine2503-C2)-methyltransferase